MFRISLSDGEVNNGYISIPKHCELFDAEEYGGKTQAEVGREFELILPDGSTVMTDIRTADADSRQSGRLRTRFYKLFKDQRYMPGTVLYISKITKGKYQLSLEGDAEKAERSFVENVKGEAPMDEITTMLNTVLCGPPGTGKTYKTTEIAVRIAAPEWYAQAIKELKGHDLRSAIKEKYEDLVAKRQVAFTTFHQSFSYEDFIEGIRAKTDEDAEIISYPVINGVFKQLALEADKAVGDGVLGLSTSPRIWKISIGRKKATDKREYCFKHGEARIGWDETGDLTVPPEEKTDEELSYWKSLSRTNQNTLTSFAEEMSVGDVVLCLKDRQTVQAVGIVASDYYYDEENKTPIEGMYSHVRDVNWLVTDANLDILAANDGKYLVQKTIYQLDRMSWETVEKVLKKNGYTPGSTSSKKPNFVLIIDEINRGNISRIFGELITLIEPSKRAGGEDAARAILPYSKTPFSVPSNLYIVGTMNTADKSLAQLDVALRRRFEFVKVEPDVSLLSGVAVHGVDVGDLLSTINQRIEVLLDRDHLIGHSYFIELRDVDSEAERQQRLARIFAQNIIPLLQEYFFDDWEKIAWVLNDHRKAPTDQFIVSGGRRSVEDLFGADVGGQLMDRRFRVNPGAYSNPRSYVGILNGYDGEL